MKYKSPRDSEKLSEVLGHLFENPKRAVEIAEDLGQARSTALRKLNALEEHGFAEKEEGEYQYHVNKQKIYDEFWTEITESIHISEEDKRKQFNSIKDNIYQNSQFKQHLLGFVETELQLTSTPLNKILTKYKDRLDIRYDYVFQLTHNDIEESDLSTEKKFFWKYLTIVQAYLPHSAWTEPIHGTALQSQLYPGQEHKIEHVDDMWHDLVDQADQNLTELSGGKN